MASFLILKEYNRTKKTIQSVPYGFSFLWCRLRDSNPRPTRYECVALPTVLSRHRLLAHILYRIFKKKQSFFRVSVWM